jgi:hypothetical protein
LILILQTLVFKTINIMNVNEKINVRSHYKDTIARIKITAISRYELNNLKKYNFQNQPNFKH